MIAGATQVKKGTVVAEKNYYYPDRVPPDARRDVPVEKLPNFPLYVVLTEPEKNIVMEALRRTKQPIADFYVHAMDYLIQQLLPQIDDVRFQETLKDVTTEDGIVDTVRAKTTPFITLPAYDVSHLYGKTGLRFHIDITNLPPEGFKACEAIVLLSQKTYVEVSNIAVTCYARHLIKSGAYLTSVSDVELLERTR